MNKELTNTLSDYFSRQPVRKAWVFGSFSRGEETPVSDVDIMIDLDYSSPVGLKFFAMVEDLKELLGRNVDLVTEQSLQPFALKTAQKDRILVYERTCKR